MILVEWARTLGLNPIKVSATVWHSACPTCGGRDRFFFHPTERGDYRCRQCGVHGNAIQFARDFLELSFQEAKARLGLFDRFQATSSKQVHINPIQFPDKSWQEKAQGFVESSHQCLLLDSKAITFMKTKYGLLPDTLRGRRIGWSFRKAFQRRFEWGLPEEEKKIWIGFPRGPVIPTFYEHGIGKIKVRDLDWAEGNTFGKYREIPGSSNLTPILGHRMNLIAILVESELDAMLLIQEIGEFCTCVALGGASKKPDEKTCKWLRERKLILYALDSDKAGRQQYNFWRSNFSNLRAWPTNSRKSPADSHIFDGVNLKNWFEEGIRYWEKRL